MHALFSVHPSMQAKWTKLKTTAHFISKNTQLSAIKHMINQISSAKEHIRQSYIMEEKKI